MNETNKFAERLEELRTANGIYQKELAIYLNVSIGTISNYENGIHQPDLNALCQLADYFGVTTDYLLGRTSIPFGHKMDPKNETPYTKRLKKIFDGILKMSASEVSAVELLVRLQNKYHIDVTRRENS